MSNGSIKNRWFVVLGAILIQLCLGAIYAWSVFTPSLVAADWTKAQTQAVFAAGLALFAIVMVIAGRLLPKWGPRKLAFSGGIVLGLGYLLAGLFGGTNFWSIFFFIGIIGGSGIGLAYVVPIAVGMRWFPDKKGLITGLAVAGFGFGAMLWVKLAGTWGNLIADLGLSTTFSIYGIVFFLTVMIGGIWMVFPPEGWKPEGWSPPEIKDSKGKTTKVADLVSSQMLKTSQYYMILL
jgi:OFA family oxalate/formate antiporter-like MFS transporter